MIRRFTSRFVGVSVIAAMGVTFSVERASADFHGVVGGIIFGCATGVLNCKGQKRRTTSRSAPKKSGISSAQRAQNRDVQNALNGFGWNVGSADGVLGRNSRAGIRQYEAYMGWNPDGRLNDFERETLVNSWNRMQAGGGNAYPNMMAREGGRGLLRTSLNPNYPAQFGDNVGGGTFANNGVAPTTGYNGTQPTTGYGGNYNDGSVAHNNNGFNPNAVPQVPQVVTPTVQANNQTGGALAPLPQLGGQTIANASIASRCQIVDLKTEAAQGAILANNLTDPDQALSEKFCDAVKFSVAKSNGRIAGTGLPEAQLAQACGQIQDKVAPVFGQLSSGNVPGTLQQMQTVNAELGLSNAANAEAYGEICVGMGYRTDDAEMALAGTLVLIGAGKMPYSELVGHHVREGFGVSAAPAASQEWYLQAVTSLEQGSAPAFEPSSTQDRVAVIRAAIERGGLQAGVGALPNVIPASSTTALPPLK